MCCNCDVVQLIAPGAYAGRLSEVCITNARPRRMDWPRESVGISESAGAFHAAASNAGAACWTTPGVGRSHAASSAPTSIGTATAVAVFILESLGVRVQCRPGPGLVCEGISRGAHGGPPTGRPPTRPNVKTVSLAGNGRYYYIVI